MEPKNRSKAWRKLPDRTNAAVSKIHPPPRSASTASAARAGDPTALRDRESGTGSPYQRGGRAEGRRGPRDRVRRGWRRRPRQQDGAGAGRPARAGGGAGRGSGLCTKTKQNKRNARVALAQLLSLLRPPLASPRLAAFAWGFVAAWLRPRRRARRALLALAAFPAVHLTHSSRVLVLRRACCLGSPGCRCESLCRIESSRRCEFVDRQWRGRECAGGALDVGRWN
jgi:hypothetical protein